LAYQKHIDEYRRQSVTSASPLQLVVMLYDGALRFMEQSLAAMAAQELERQNDRLVRAQRIIAELIGTLDMEQGGEVAKNLLGLYTFAYNELVEGNLRDDADRIRNAIRVMSELRDGWMELEQRGRGPSLSVVDGGAGAPIAA